MSKRLWNGIRNRATAQIGILAVLATAVVAGYAPPVVAQSDTYYPGFIRQGWGPRCLTGNTAPFKAVAGIDTRLQGVGAAFYDINGNGKPDLLLMGVQNPPQMNSFGYRILWDIDKTGTPAVPISAEISAPGLGWEAQGGGAALTEIDGNDRPELILMAYDNPPATNEFRYRVGWNLDKAGKPAKWSGMIRTSGFGDPPDTSLGAGVATGFIDGNAIPDIVFTATGSPTRYKIGFDLGSTGEPAAWSPAFTAPALRGDHIGGSAVLTDVDLDGQTDLLLAAYQKGSGTKAGGIVYRIGWNLSNVGFPSDWSREFRLSGYDASAGGLGIAHVLDRDLGSVLVLADHQTTGSGEFDTIFRLNALPLTTSGTSFGAAIDSPPPVGGTLQVPSGMGDMVMAKLLNLNMSTVRNAARDAVMTFWFNAAIPAPGSVNWHDYPDASGNFAIMLNNAFADPEITPDFLVAAVAWYVDQNMGYTYDPENGYVLNTIHSLGYTPAGHNIPAHYTIRFTNPLLPANSNMIPALQAKNPAWAAEYNDGKSYHGDCEDYAILRHALLRSLGFDRRFIWNAESPSHVHNIVLYNGAYRIMDYGPIQRYLCCASPINDMVFQSWNTDFDEASGAELDEVFWHYVVPRALPDQCGETGWLFSRHARPDLDGSCVDGCK